MSLRRWLLVPALALLPACGGESGADDSPAADSAADAGEGGDAGDAGAASSSPTRADSIPIEISVTISGGAERDGTYTARGMGDLCIFDPLAKPGATHAAWRVVYASSDSAKTAVPLLTLDAGAPTGDATSAFALRVRAGNLNSAGVTMPAMYDVATWPTGLKLGSGTVTVRRQGEGARFTIDAVDGASKARIAATVTCATLGSAQ